MLFRGSLSYFRCSTRPPIGSNLIPLVFVFAEFRGRCTLRPGCFFRGVVVWAIGWKLKCCFAFFPYGPPRATMNPLRLLWGFFLTVFLAGQGAVAIEMDVNDPSQLLLLRSMFWRQYIRFR